MNNFSTTINLCQSSNVVAIYGPDLQCTAEGRLAGIYDKLMISHVSQTVVDNLTQFGLSKEFEKF